MVRPEGDSTKDYYKTLGLTYPCNAIDIRKAFLDLARTQHPDKNPGREAEYQVKFQEITVAYDVLKDPSLKRIYDQVRPLNKTAPATQKSAYAHATTSASQKAAAAATAARGHTARSGFHWNSYFDEDGWPRQAKTAPRRAPTAAKPAPQPQAQTRPQSTYTREPFPPSATKPGVFGKDKPQVNKATKPSTRPQTAQPQTRPAANPAPQQAPRSEPKPRPASASKPQPKPEAMPADGWWKKSKSAYSTTGVHAKFDPRTPEPVAEQRQQASPFEKTSTGGSSANAGNARFTPGGKKAKNEYEWQHSRTAYQTTPLYKSHTAQPLDADRMDDFDSSDSDQGHAHASASDSDESDYRFKSRSSPHRQAAASSVPRKTAVPVSRRKPGDAATPPFRAAAAFASTFTPVNPGPSAPTQEATSATRKFSFKFTPPPAASSQRPSASSPRVATPLSFSNVPDFNFSSSSPQPVPPANDKASEASSDESADEASDNASEHEDAMKSDGPYTSAEPVSETLKNMSLNQERPSKVDALVDGFSKLKTAQDGSKPAYSFTPTATTQPAFTFNLGANPSKAPVEQKSSFESHAHAEQRSPFDSNAKKPAFDFSNVRESLPTAGPSFKFTAPGTTPSFKFGTSSAKQQETPEAPQIPIELLKDAKWTDLSDADYVAAYLKRRKNFQAYTDAWLTYQEKMLPLCATTKAMRLAHWTASGAYHMVCRMQAEIEIAHNMKMKHWAHDA